MIRLSDLSVRSKVLLIVALGLISQLFLALTALHYLNKSEQILARAVDMEAEGIRQAARVRLPFLEMIISEKNLILATSEEGRSAALATIDMRQRETETELRRLDALAQPAARKDIAAFRKGYNAYLADQRQIRDMVSKNQVEGATRLSIGRARQHRAEARDALLSLMDDLDANLDRYRRDGEVEYRNFRNIMIGLPAATLFLCVVFGLLATRSIATGLNRMVAVADSIAAGNLETRIDTSRRDEVGRLAVSVDGMQSALRAGRAANQLQDWLKTGLARLKEVMLGDPGIETLSSKVISEMAAYLGAQVGAIYIARDGDKPTFVLTGTYAYTKRKNLYTEFRPGEGLVGQAALEKQQILVRDVPEDYVKVTSGLGEHVPRFICVTPFLHEGRVKGVIEIGTLNELTDRELAYLVQAAPALAFAVQSAEGRSALAASLEASRRLSAQLQAQQEELKASNEELESQTQRLKESEERLRAQQDELRVTNEELEEKNDLLQRQKREVELARKHIEEKAGAVALASRYKSEFLANMSHELRTPLNSLLLLSQDLAQNTQGNLTADQVESAKIIHGGGSDLLHLINEILDLSRIEAGRMDLQPAEIRVSDLADGIRASFRHMAGEKGLGLEVSVGEDAPAVIVSDRKRADQVLRNLLSNAVKFTDTGSVTVTFGRPAPGTDLSQSGLSAGECLAVSVRDTGIGIPEEQKKIVFEAFQQVDGGTARKYGGTGLGLSISRELARLLGGEIQLESRPGKGSTFTLYLPVAVRPTRNVPACGTTSSAVSQADEGARSASLRPGGPVVEIEDDRGTLEVNDRVILVVEDDSRFARILRDKCHERGFKCLAAATGEAGLELARKHLPGGVILDIRLPGMDGWAVLGALKEDTRTRHIPVHIVSVEGTSTEALRKGAIGHATKPLDPNELEGTFSRLREVSAGRTRHVLVVEDDPEIRRSIVQLIGGGDVHVDEAGTGEQALEALRCISYDCMVLDLGLPDMTGHELLARIEQDRLEAPPVIVHTGRDLTRDEESRLRGHAESIVIKGVRSPERLLDEVSLFLHRVVSKMPDRKRQVILDLHDTDAILRDRKVLIVDDDMRTTFALSRLLSDRGMKPLKAENGEKALSVLDREPDVDLVFMDIMMPVMDGYEAMGRIRAQDRFSKLPIIALTAKAMPEDRGKCLAAGANDYLSKPVDQDRMISMMRVWLYR